MMETQKMSFRTVFAILFSLAVIASFGVVTGAEDAPLSVGKTYTFDTIPALHNYPDPMRTKLTDGILAKEPDFMQPEWVGFWTTESFALTIDLGDETEINEIRMHHMAGVAGITWPTQIVVHVLSAYGDAREPLEMKIDNVLPARPVTRWFTFDDVDLEGRWIQITYTAPSEGRNIFISEIEVR